MRLSRLTLTCVLALGVALQGYAEVRAMDPACGMTHAASGHHAPEADIHAAHVGAEHGGHGPGGSRHDSPPGDTPSGETAHSQGDSVHCACFGGCHPASPATALLARQPASPLLMREQLLLQEQSFRSHTVFRHWRPPASI